jgi:general secretion pathway protein D
MQRPWVSTLNHKLATISTGQQIAIAGQTYSTGTTTTNTAGIYSTTQYIPVELRLDVIPHIYANNEIKLEFNQTNNDVSGFTTISGNQVPNLSTQSLKNTIIIPDGDTILLGGLITQRDTDNKTGLPFLSRIPLLGSLFSNTTKNRERDELLIFVQPHIVNNGGDYIQDQAQLEKLVRSDPTVKTFINTGEAPPDKKRAKEAKGHPIPEGSVNTNIPAVNSDIPSALPVDQSLDSRFGK